MIDGSLIINGAAGEARAAPAGADPDRRQFAVRVGRTIRRCIDFRGPRRRWPCRCAGCRWSAKPCPAAGASTRSSSAAPPSDNFGPITVPAGHLWLMGDNRDDSAPTAGCPNGRGGLGGPVPFENIGGRAEFITFSLDGSTSWWNPLTWFEALRPAAPGSRCRSS